jgi:hypothetical protein
MPLIKSGSKKAFSTNVGEMTKSGHPKGQALAAAYSVKRKAQHKARGGEMEAPHGSVESYEDCTQCGMPMSKSGKHMCSGGEMYAEGGKVDDQRSLHTSSDSENPELEETTAAPPEAGEGEMVDYDLPSEAGSSMDEMDLPKVSEALSLAAEIMKDRKRRSYAMGGKIDSDSGSLQEALDAPNDSYLDKESEEMDAPKEDGRWQRGLNAGQVHTMEDEEHDTSDSSLVAEILRDRKKRRFGM